MEEAAGVEHHLHGLELLHDLAHLLALLDHLQLVLDLQGHVEYGGEFSCNYEAAEDASKEKLGDRTTHIVVDLQLLPVLVEVCGHAVQSLQRAVALPQLVLISRKANKHAVQDLPQDGLHHLITCMYHTGNRV